MPRSTCGGCGKIFTSTTMFEKHRIGNFEEPVYEARTTGKTMKIVGYTPPTRRCMTTQELVEAGYQFERKSITYYREGQKYEKEGDIWYDPKAREEARAHFRGREESEEEDDG